MSRKKDDTKTLKENITLIIKGYKILSKIIRPMLISDIIIYIVQSIIPFVNIYFSAQILNELTSTQNKDKLFFLVALIIGINLILMIIKSIFSRISSYYENIKYISLFKIYTDKLFSMDYIDIENPKIMGKHSTLIQHQHGMGFGLSRLTWIYHGIISGVISVIMSVVMAISMFTLLVPKNSELEFLNSPIAIIIVIFIILCMVFVAPRIVARGEKIISIINRSEDNNKANRLFSFYFYELLSNNDAALDIRIYNQEKMISNVDKSLGAFAKYSSHIAKYKALSSIVSFLSYGAIYLFIALKAMGGAFSVGGIVQYIGAISQFTTGFSNITLNVGMLFSNNAVLEDVIKFLEIENKKYQGTLAVEKRDDFDYEIEFKNVSFKYSGVDTYALKNVNMKLNTSQKMAVVGMNGSGKTTMIKLLSRLYDPTEGVITLNGIDIKKYDYNEYMDIFGVVFQDFMLLPFTLGENVSTSSTYDENKVNDCLNKAGFSTRLETFPKGLNTYLYKNCEEDGIEVSGGEAQKIALARALYKNAPMLILDEPTAALDPIAEAEIYANFNQMVGDRTAIYISHRLSSCRFCNDIVVFHKGELIERGNHEELIKNENSKYYELWTSQAQHYN